MNPGDLISGKYLVEHTLGEGGMGVVLAVRHLELSAPMAIKVPEPRGPADDRLLHEARLTARLTSDHVVRVYDAGRSESGVPYMVLERLEGHDLHDLLGRRGHVPSEEAALYVSQACLALEEAHAIVTVKRDC